MMQVQSEFSKAKLLVKYKKEIELVSKRQKWLAALIDDSQTVLHKLKTQQHADESKAACTKSTGDADASERASSTDMASMVRAGPCTGCDVNKLENEGLSNTKQNRIHSAGPTQVHML